MLVHSKLPKLEEMISMLNSRLAVLCLPLKEFSESRINWPEELPWAAAHRHPFHF